ncbi:MAG: esterase-like activity of phytase family protein [Candidatus Omnitrophica bacterium]|nr:esterase-like activity of phytase family protein [Candidatus Omnitrophota bacterium]
MLIAALFTGAVAVLPAGAEITLIAEGKIPGTQSDMSGQRGLLEDGTPQDRLGAFGSAIAYTGSDDRYICVPDRGTLDGKTNYLNRFHEFDIGIARGKVRVTLVRTTLLSNETGVLYTGVTTAFDPADKARNRRLDPEGARVGRNGALFIADEYGPSIYEFDPKTGRLIRTLDVPEKFLISHPAADAGKELPPFNTSGRQANRSMEGLAISPDGRKLFGIMQGPLIQDNGLDAERKRHGINCRILEIAVSSGSTREYLYQLDNAKNGLNEILAVNGSEFLVIERDGKGGKAAGTKKIYLIDIAKATDISSVALLPATGAPPGVVPVDKKLFIDLLDPRYGIAGKNCPDKFEGLAFGPDLKDGRHLLWVTTDNDFVADEPSRLYAFAVGRDDLPGFKAQEFRATRFDFTGIFIAVCLMIVILGFRKKPCAL